ncbi:MAG: hypothetical protein VX204_02005 [Candidatus Thermoplasmatota archaeon]|nr:hypothetical protein [Candidatus Thermoplasmatota archaeon]
MAKVRVGLISLLMIMSLTSPATFAQDDNRATILADEFETEGPVWISATCAVGQNCSGMELVLWNNGSEYSHQYSHQDSHLVEWAGWVEGNVAWEIVGGEGVHIEAIDVILSYMDDWTEHEDLPDTVPSPGSQGDYPNINTSSPCRLQYCGALDMISEGVLYVGALEDQIDKDAVMIVGDSGDVMLLNSLRGPNATTIEVWHRSDESKSLVDSLESADLPHYFEYPAEGELWLRIVHSFESGYSPYEFEIIRYDDDIEAPGGGELSNPWSHGEPMPFQGQSSLVYHGHLAASDSQGDSLLIASGSKIRLQPHCTFTGAVSVSIILHQADGTQAVITSGCEQVFETTAQTVSVEFGFTTQDINAAWTVMLRSLSPRDGGLIGDAPDVIWEHGNMDSRWQVLNLDASVISGFLDSSDTTDYYAFSITEENGSYVRVQRISDSPGSFTLMTLDQGTGEVVNSTDGSMMIVPPGVHALRVDWEQGMEGSLLMGNYQFSLPYNAPYVPEEGEFVDLSHRASGFYMLAGLLLLTPLAMVIWWNRDAIFRGAPLAADIQEHERRRLRSLRERLSAALAASEVDQVEIEHSLRQLGESPWKAVVEDWGDPVMRHLTERVEICVWRVAESASDLLIGIRVEREPWELAAIRVHAPEGSSVGILSVSPQRMYQDGEVFLDTLTAGSKTFIGIELEGSPTTIGFHLSGLVDGEPLAAVPNKSLDW